MFLGSLVPWSWGKAYQLLDSSIEEFDQSQKTRRREAVSGGKTPPPVKDDDDDKIHVNMNMMTSAIKTTHS